MPFIHNGPINMRGIACVSVDTLYSLYVSVY